MAMVCDGTGEIVMGAAVMVMGGWWADEIVSVISVTVMEPEPDTTAFKGRPSV